MTLLLSNQDGDASECDAILDPMGSVRHLAIAGNMGVGKSTLTRVLAERFDAPAYFETVEGHPYLERFYLDMQRWAFQSQFYFLTQAFQQHCEILQATSLCIQDRTIYEHYHVFATSLHSQGLMSDDDYGVLSDHFEALTSILPGPDVMIYLRASVDTLIERIQKRDRGCEATVERAYLEHLEAHYATWMDQYEASDLLIVDTDSIDVHQPEQCDELVRSIELHLAQRVKQLALAV